MKFIIRLLDANFESPILKMEAKNCKELCEKVFGKIEILSEEDLEN